MKEDLEEKSIINAEQEDYQKAALVWQPEHQREDFGRPSKHNERTFTVEEAIDEIGFGSTQVIVITIVGLCWIADSMEMLLLSFIGPQLRCVWELSSFDEALITTVVFIGMMIGAYGWGVISDIFGRRKALFGSAFFSFFFGMCCAFAPSYPFLIFCRGGVGIGVGGIPVGFSLLMEFTPKHIRGPIGIAFGGMLSIGGMLEAALAWTLHYYGKDWRWLIALSTVPMGFVLMLFVFLPESPQYYMYRGKAFKCLQLLQKMANRRGKQLVGSLTYEDRRKKGNVRDLFTAQVINITVLQLIIWWICAFCYYGVLLITTQLFNMEEEGLRCKSYGLSIDNESGACQELTRSAYEDVFVTSIGELPGLVVTGYLVHAIGRKQTIAVESIVQAFCCGLLIYCVGRRNENILLFILRGTTNGIFRVAYLYTGEVYPASVKSTALGTCSSIARLGGMITPYIAQVVTVYNDTIGISIYVAASIVCAIAACLLPIDTNNIPMPDSLAELQMRLKLRKVVVPPPEIASDSTSLLASGTETPVYSTST
eukprot:c19846_g2_i1.p1 GENE.c19846_g2_i1~~c19846_g2_i1.p1  ORF type:complete len:539 (+),score=191.52 c19846_g2_i1:549-2165(+)